MTGLIAGVAASFAAALYLLATAFLTGFSAQATETQHSTYFIVGHFGLLFVGFLINVGWGVGYAYLAARTPQLVARPLVSGIVFGLFVLLMSVVFETGGKVTNWVTLAEAGRQIVGYAFFYGVPLAFLTSRRLRGT